MQMMTRRTLALGFRAWSAKNMPYQVRFGVFSYLVLCRAYNNNEFYKWLYM